MKWKLCLNGNLFGRKDEIEKLCDIRQRLFVENAPVQACFVHGLSGSGKTSLCRVIKESSDNMLVENEKLYFLEGKFDQYLDSSIPYSALVHALDSLAAQIVKSLADNGRENDEALDTMKMFLETEGKILTEVVPSLGEVMLGDKSDTAADYDDTSDENLRHRLSHQQSEVKRLVLASKRVALAFRAFFKSFCSSMRPVILFIDDMQWADPNSLDVLSAIVNDADAHNLLLLGGYRDEDEGTQNLVKPFLESLTMVQIENVAVSNLNMNSICDLLASALSLNYRDEKEEALLLDLESVVHRKTMGNPFFVVQFVQMPEHEQVLLYNPLQGAWTWNISEILATTSVSENVAEIVTRRLEGVVPEVRRLLYLAACLGFQLDRSLLQSVYSNKALLDRIDDSLSGMDLGGGEAPLSPSLEEKTIEGEDYNFDHIIALAESENLIETVGSSIKFSHDRIRQFAYELILQGPRRSSLHYTIGKYLYELYGGKSTYVMLIADQLNRGTSICDQDDDRVLLIKLNLEASRMARKRSAEGLVMEFLNKAFKLILDTDWTSSYDVVMEVHHRLAEMESMRNNPTRSNALVEAMVKHSRHSEDKAAALAIHAL